MELTVRQKNAVSHRGTTLLVSAGAGSGKTSTLSKRIISRISDPADVAEIDDFLIVTFTNASAADLCEKIEKAVTECVARDVKNAKAMRQLAKIKYANISTISSFCMNVVRRHFQLLGLPAKIRICDETEAVLLKDRVLNSIIEEKYETQAEDSPFFTAVELFSGGKNDDAFVAYIDKLHRKIMSYPHPEGWMEKVLGFYYEVVEADDFLDTYYGSMCRKYMLDAACDFADALRGCLERMRDIPELEPYSACLSRDLDNIVSAISVTEHGTYNDVRNAVLAFSKVTLKKADYDEDFKKSIQETRNKAFEKFKDARSSFFGAEGEKIKLAAKDCTVILKELFELVRETDKRFSQEKKDRGLIDFSDAERFTYNLFIKNTSDSDGKPEITPIAQKYRDSFIEIYIDEYQDINPIQDMIFRAICKYDENGRELNRFMVGDIKQSIYRFRGAQPDLFAAYLNSFSHIDEGKAECEHKEYLSDNFRCSESVVDFTNLVFSQIMNDSYSEKDKLVYSRTESLKYDKPCDIVVYDDEADETADYYDSEIKVCAQKILDVVNNPKYLSSNGTPFGFGDVAVLMPSPKKVADKYAKYFESCGIPTYSEITENFFDNAEIVLCMCLLNSIDNPLRDIYITGAMRSEIFGFTDDDLLSVRRFYPEITGFERSMWQSVKDIAGCDCAERKLKEKCLTFVTVIESFREYSVGMSSDKLILKLYSELHMMNVVSEKSFNRFTENAQIRRENLMILYNLARTFEKTSFRGLSAFLDYLNDRAQKPDSVRSATSSDSNCAVRIMSIHHSKGLEFPVCILCGMSKNFNKTDEQSRLVISDEAGIGFKLRDIKGLLSCDSTTAVVSYETPFRAAVKSRESEQLTEEQKRVLYVGMTRAKDMLVMLLKKPAESHLLTYYRNSISKNKSARPQGFYDWIYSCICGYDKARLLFDGGQMPSDEALVDVSNCFDISTALPVYMQKAQNDITGEDIPQTVIDELAQRIEKKLNFVYPHSDVVNIPSKISVSDLKRNLNISESSEDAGFDSFEEPDFVKKGGLSAAERGTAMHMFMQFADYKKCEVSVECEAKRLLEQGYISGEQYAVLDYKKLAAFFESEIYMQICGSPKVYRESGFTLNTSISDIYGNDFAHSQETVLVQGKIDCFFETQNGGFVIVDFKSDIATEQTLCERYRVQLEYYRRAVREMTGNPNVRTFIYSFHLSESFEV